MPRLFALLAISAGLAGCSPGPIPVPPPSIDGGGLDGGLHLDGGPQPDAGPATGPDAGPLDAGLRCTGRTQGAGNFDFTLSSGGRSRRYLLHVPPQYQTARPTMLVVALHGFLMSPESMKSLTHFDQASDERGFLVAYPEGVATSFNAGACCGTAAALGVDDVGFVEELIDAVSTQFCVDPSRVHVTGFSNGGFLTHRVGCELAGKVASIGPVAGQVGVSTCTPSRPMPVLMIHGTADPVVPYAGNLALGYSSTQSTMSGWAQRNGCSTTPLKLWDDGGNTSDTWPGCNAGAEVTLHSLGGALHDWIGGPTLDAGRYNTTRELVNFFERHPRP